MWAARGESGGRCPAGLGTMLNSTVSPQKGGVVHMAAFPQLRLAGALSNSVAPLSLGSQGWAGGDNGSARPRTPAYRTLGCWS